MNATSIDSYRSAGFWIRLSACLIDVGFIYAALSLAEVLLNYFQIYVPFELIFFLSFPVYEIFALSWKQKTIGKWLCGLIVVAGTDQRVGIVRASFRETIGKLISGLFFFVGFLWILFSKNKRGWHDYISRTKVGQHIQARRRGSIITTVVLGASMVWIAFTAFRFYGLYKDAESMTLPVKLTTRYADRDPKSLIEISALKDDDVKQCADWLDEHGKDPVDYAVEAAKNHQVTIFGEQHWRKDEHLFLNRIIPDLYHKAGVRCLALEVCRAEDDGRLSTLVTADTFDRDLAIDIKRSDNWEAWGAKEYWDVLETVWKLNRTIPIDQQKMRVVGIDTRWDGPSFACIQAGIDTTTHGPWWEKLRILRLGPDIFRFINRDELMARNIEKEILEKNDHGVVWVGAAHSFTNWELPIVNYGGKLIREWGRMGIMLHQKYGDKISQVLLHWKDDSPKLVYAMYQGSSPHFSDFLEEVMARRKNAPVGFTVSGSPFESMRDSNAYYYHFQPRVNFSDIASGYIFLKPVSEILGSSWIPGFVSEKMFIKNKPYYEICVGHSLQNAQEADSNLMDFVKRELSK